MAAANTNTPKITLYVDTVSPFAYEAYHILRNDAIFKGVDITYVPIFLGGLMHKCGNTAPMKVKNKDKWINVERLRWAMHFGIPMSASLPPDFPAPTLPVMRALAALPSQEKLTKALDVLFQKHWVDRVATHDPATLKEILVEVFSAEEAESILEKQKGEAKANLTANTDRAFNEGAFGLPWMMCTDASGKTEGFWGVDHLGQVVQFLGLKGPAPAGNKGWRALL